MNERAAGEDDRAVLALRSAPRGNRRRPLGDVKHDAAADEPSVAGNVKTPLIAVLVLASDQNVDSRIEGNRRVADPDAAAVHAGIDGDDLIVEPRVRVIARGRDRWRREHARGQRIAGPRDPRRRRRRGGRIALERVSTGDRDRCRRDIAAAVEIHRIRMSGIDDDSARGGHVHAAVRLKCRLDGRIQHVNAGFRVATDTCDRPRRNAHRVMTKDPHNENRQLLLDQDFDELRVPRGPSR